MISRSTSSLIAAAGSRKASRLCLSCSSEVAPTITEPCATKGRVRHHRMASCVGERSARAAMAAYSSAAWLGLGLG